MLAENYNRESPGDKISIFSAGNQLIDGTRCVESQSYYSDFMTMKSK